MVGVGIHSSFDCVKSAFKDKNVLPPQKGKAMFYKKRLKAFAELLSAQASVYALTNI